ncbi:DCC1-like thiol-disulfide oxidoreductase family protein [Methylocucumis oryzae]|uniref:DCC1-like thiol-disulfide oxidoreductase family protein n=1 Tax=Methylocucumis oryzae TaxID=1632867 RepID=UPI0030846B76
MLAQSAPATGIGVYRILYGLVTLQEIIFLYYFSHLIFDPIPFIDVEFPTINYFLGFWAVIAIFLVVGYRYRFATVCNYLLWLVFVNFTPMQRDFDGGFDLFMTGMGFFLLFMPGDRAFALDGLRAKLQTPFMRIDKPQAVTVLAYYVPVIIGLGFLYFDSAIHKLFAEHWRHGLGAWLPCTQPYYVSVLDMSFLLNNEMLEKTIGYTILLFQFSFIFLFAHKKLRLVYLLLGAGLHLGITVSFNIYPFGLGMLICYSLLIPYEFWQGLAARMVEKSPSLTVFYDRDCPLCNRTVLTIEHFDIFKRIDFKNAQDYAQRYPRLASLDEQMLLTDLYALDAQGHLFAGVDTYIQICLHMRTMAWLGGLLSLPGVKTYAVKTLQTNSR